MDDYLKIEKAALAIAGILMSEHLKNHHKELGDKERRNWIIETQATIDNVLQVPTIKSSINQIINNKE